LPPIAYSISRLILYISIGSDFEIAPAAFLQATTNFPDKALSPTFPSLIGSVVSIVAFEVPFKTEMAETPGPSCKYGSVTVYVATLPSTTFSTLSR